MYDILLATNLLLWLALVFRFVSKPMTSVRHPASFYLLAHGCATTILLMVVLFKDFDFISNISSFLPSEATRIALLLVSLILAAALRWTHERSYNLKRDHWTFMFALAVSSVLVFVAAVGVPLVLTHLKNTLQVSSLNDKLDQK